MLGAVYAVERLDPASRHVIAPVLHKAMRWRGVVGPALIAHLAGTNSTALSTFADPRAWAMDVLGFPPGPRDALPEGGHGPVPVEDAQRAPRPRRRPGVGASTAVFELAEARKILTDAAAVDA